MPNNLTFFAGEIARSLIKEKGLQPEMVKVIAGAAGGPKFLVLNHIDRFLFSDWLSDTTGPIDLIGSSIGAWRFAALSMMQPLEAYNSLQTAYMSQSYDHRPNRNEVSAESLKIMDAFLGDEGIGQILTNNRIRLNILSVKCRWPVSSDNKLLLGLGLSGAAIGNLLSRKTLGAFFKRALFHHPGGKPVFFQESEFPIDRIVLSAVNLRQALISSGSIPFVMKGVTGISNAPKGTYRDGGLVDYHMDIPYGRDNPGIVLFPHYTDKVVPGWLDKKLSWRKPNRQNMRNVLLVAPSQDFVKNLPYGKIPDRNDFFKFEGQDEIRIKYWEEVIDKSKVLADDLRNAFSNDLADVYIQPFPE